MLAAGGGGCQTLRNLRSERRLRRRRERRGRSSGSLGARAPRLSRQSRLPQLRPEDLASASARPPRLESGLSGGVGGGATHSVWNPKDRRQRPPPIWIIGGERDFLFGEGESRALSAPGRGRCPEPTGIGWLSPSCRNGSSNQAKDRSPASSSSPTPALGLAQEGDTPHLSPLSRRGDCPSMSLSEGPWPQAACAPLQGQESLC